MCLSALSLDTPAPPLPTHMPVGSLAPPVRHHEHATLSNHIVGGHSGMYYGIMFHYLCVTITASAMRTFPSCLVSLRRNVTLPLHDRSICPLRRISQGVESLCLPSKIQTSSYAAFAWCSYANNANKLELAVSKCG